MQPARLNGTHDPRTQETEAGRSPCETCDEVYITNSKPVRATHSDSVFQTKLNKTKANLQPKRIVLETEKMSVPIRVDDIMSLIHKKVKK